MTAQKFITEANKQKVCQLLGWTIGDYTAYQEAKGLEYLADQICGDEWSVNSVAKCALYWRWWINHWNARDAEFIGLASKLPTTMLHFEYDRLNDLDGFKFYPHRIIMEQSYAAMIDGINQQAVEVAKQLC